MNQFEKRLFSWRFLIAPIIRIFMVLLTIFHAAILLVSLQVISAHAELRKAKFAAPTNLGANIDAATRQFQKELDKALGAPVELRTVPLRSGRAILEFLRNGQIDIALVPLSMFGATVGPGAAALYQPWAYQDMADVRKAEESEIGAQVMTSLEKAGFIGLGFWNLAWSRIATKTKLASLEDLKGLKIRSSKSGVNLLSAIGTIPVQIQAAEVYTALKRGAVDGMEFISGPTFERRGLEKLVTTVVDKPFRPTVLVFLTRAHFWRNLRYREQVMLSRAVKATGLWTDSNAESQDQTLASRAQALGVVYLPISAKDQARIRRTSLKVWSNGVPTKYADYLERAIRIGGERRLPEPIPERRSQQSVKLLFATDRKFEGGNDLDFMFGSSYEFNRLHFGAVNAIMPLNRRLGSEGRVRLNTPVFLSTDPEEFNSALNEAFGASQTKRLLVFIHGYNNTLTQALRRAAAFAADIGFDGVVLVYSWPSDGATLAYGYDEESIDITKRNLARFMEQVASNVPAAAINILAHSMGSRVLLEYLSLVEGDSHFPKRGRFGRIIFAAPDVNFTSFRLSESVLLRAAKRITVYSSQHDRALWVSEQVHDRKRVGRPRSGDIYVHENMDSVDASKIDNTWFNFSPRHAYVFSKKKGLEDIGALIMNELTAGQRRGLRRHIKNNIFYWSLTP